MGVLGVWNHVRGLTSEDNIDSRLIGSFTINSSVHGLPKGNIPEKMTTLSAFYLGFGGTGATSWGFQVIKLIGSNIFYLRTYTSSAFSRWVKFSGTTISD